MGLARGFEQGHVRLRIRPIMIADSGCQTEWVEVDGPQKSRGRGLRETRQEEGVGEGRLKDTRRKNPIQVYTILTLAKIDNLHR